MPLPLANASGRTSCESWEKSEDNAARFIRAAPDGDCVRALPGRAIAVSQRQHEDGASLRSETAVTESAARPFATTGSSRVCIGRAVVGS